MSRGELLQLVHKLQAAQANQKGEVTMGSSQGGEASEEVGHLKEELAKQHRINRELTVAISAKDRIISSRQGGRSQYDASRRQTGRPARPQSARVSTRHGGGSMTAR